jgi:SAM-dependent methyltransferase
MPGLKRYFHENTAFRYFVLYFSPTWRGISTLNYGYSPVSQEVLNAAIARNQAFQIELYRQVFLALGRPLSPEQCLCEISCGRGGGLAFIAGRTPARCIGLEKSWPALLYARWKLGLDARASVAPAIALEPASVDAFISVEAFHNYANDRFLQEAARCLKPGGNVVIADRRRGSLEENRQFEVSLFERNGFTITTFRDITPNILEALRGDHDRKERLLRWVSGTFVYDELREMFACVGSKRYKAFESGEWSYFLFSATKTRQTR